MTAVARKTNGNGGQADGGPLSRSAVDKLLPLSHDRAMFANALICLPLLIPQPADDISVLVYPATPENPRYTEGSVIRLKTGSLLFAITEFIGKGTDFSTGRIIGRESTDGGRTWGPSRVLQKNTGKQNVMSVTLKRLSADRIAMFCLEKNSHDDLHMFVRFSDDETQTFGERVLVTAGEGYHIVNNDRVIRLKSGRLLVPVSYTRDIKDRNRNHITSHCVFSDDDGLTWTRGSGSVDLPKRGAMEPDCVQLRDGRVLMILRTQLGYIARSYSADGGNTWSKPESTGIKAPESPATIRRIPTTGDLVLIWNHTWVPGSGHGGRRTPLTSAVSADEGRTWKHFRSLEGAASRTFAYTSLTFIDNRAIMTYWETSPDRPGISSRFRSIPTERLYPGE